jgi:hypothetical protein
MRCCVRCSPISRSTSSPEVGSYLAFLFSWLGWGPQALYEQGLLPFSPPLLGLLGGVGPTLAAVVVILLLRALRVLRG